MRGCVILFILFLHLTEPLWLSYLSFSVKNFHFFFIQRLLLILLSVVTFHPFSLFFITGTNFLVAFSCECLKLSQFCWKPMDELYCTPSNSNCISECFHIFYFRRILFPHFVQKMNNACNKAETLSPCGDCSQSLTALRTCRLVKNQKVTVRCVWSRALFLYVLIWLRIVRPFSEVVFLVDFIMARGVTVPVDVTLVYVTKSNVAFAAISFFFKKKKFNLSIVSLHDDGFL